MGLDFGRVRLGPRTSEEAFAKVVVGSFEAVT